MRHENGKGQQKDNHIGKKDQLSAEEKKRLGLDRPITRRDFMKAMAIGTASLMVPGCSGLTFDTNSPPDSKLQSRNMYFGGNTENARSVCHQVRDGKHFSRGSEYTGEIYDLVVVGAGLGGLTSAYFFNQERSKAKILLLDLLKAVIINGKLNRNTER